MHKFRAFLLNENTNFLSNKVGDILEALQSISEDAPNMGTRHLLTVSKDVVSEIRKVLHETWAETEIDVLRSLQKIGVALMRAIEENEPIGEVLESSIGELEDVLKKSGKPINDLGSEESDE